MGSPNKYFTWVDGAPMDFIMQDFEAAFKLIQEDIEEMRTQLTFEQRQELRDELVGEDSRQKVKSDGGSTPSQYGIPNGSKDLQDLIEHRGMDFATGNIFKACYRLGTKNDDLYEINKILWFANRLKAIAEGNDNERNRG